VALTIRPKRSFTSAAVPSGLLAYELAINGASPAKIWIGSADGLSNVMVASMAIADHIGTTDNLTQGTSNKFYADSLARAALSSSATGLTYTSATGVISLTSGYSIPSTSSQTNWDSGYTQRLQWDGGSTSLVAATGRTSLGLVIGTNVQAWDADLDAIAAIAGTTGLLKKTAANTWLLDTTAYSTTTGTVTSVSASVPTGLSISGSPITSSGTLAIALTAGYAIPTTASQTTWDTSYTNRITSLTTTGSSGSATLLTNTLNVPSYTLAGLGGIGLTSLSSTATGITYTNTTGAFSTTSGYAIPTTASQTTWDTAYTNRITSLTTTGTSGAATLITNVLNIPNHTLAGLSGQPLATNLTSVAGLTYVSASFVKMSAAGTFALDTSTYLTANQNVTLSGDVSGSGTTAITTTLATVTIAKGGTGQTTANAAVNALLPSQTSNSGKYLTTDGTSTSWGAVSSGTTIPSGSLQMYAGAVTQSASAGAVTTTAPTGWLLANGDIVSRTTYSALFTAIGTTYGVGDGLTTFALPDMRSRVPVGVGTGSGLTARTLGGTVGQENTTLLEANLPPHQHAFSPTGTLNTENSHYHASADAGSHQHTGTNGWQPLVFTSTGGGANLSSGTSYQRYNMESVMNAAGSHNHGNTNVNSGHTHTFTPTTGQTTGNGAGTSASFTNMPPAIGMNYIIKT